jgi:hypothetical protein
MLPTELALSRAVLPHYRVSSLPSRLHHDNRAFRSKGPSGSQLGDLNQVQREQIVDPTNPVFLGRRPPLVTQEERHTIASLKAEPPNC